MGSFIVRMKSFRDFWTGNVSDGLVNVEYNISRRITVCIIYEYIFYLFYYYPMISVIFCLYNISLQHLFTYVPKDRIILTKKFIDKKIYPFSFEPEDGGEKNWKCHKKFYLMQKPCVLEEVASIGSLLKDNTTLNYAIHKVIVNPEKRINFGGDGMYSIRLRLERNISSLFRESSLYSTRIDMTTVVVKPVVEYRKWYLTVNGTINGRGLHLFKVFFTVNSRVIETFFIYFYLFLIFLFISYRD